MTLPAVFAIAGCVSLLVCVFGGGIKVEHFEIGQISKFTRGITGSLGVILLGVGIWTFFYNPSSRPTSPKATEILPSQSVDLPQPSETIPPANAFTPTWPPTISVPPVKTAPETPVPQLLQLTYSVGDNTQPSFSPDGKRIVFISNRDGNSEVYLMTLGESEQVRLTKTPDINEDVPSFSPDGSTIICGGESAQGGEIYLLNLDGSRIKNISNAPNSSEGRPKLIRNTFTSQKVIFDSNRSGDWEIYIAYLGMGGLEEITKVIDRPEYIDRFPNYLSATNQILFRSIVSGSLLYVMDLDGKNIRQLSVTPAGEEDYYPSASFDGKWVLFNSNRDGDGEVYVMDLEGTYLKNITNNPMDDASMTMSPDDKLIVFSSNRNGGVYQLYQVTFTP